MNEKAETRATIHGRLGHIEEGLVTHEHLLVRLAEAVRRLYNEVGMVCPLDQDEPEPHRGTDSGYLRPGDYVGR